MKIDIDMSNYASTMLIVAASCASIIFGLQGFIFKDSILRKTSYYKMESIGAIILGLMGLISIIIIIYKY